MVVYGFVVISGPMESMVVSRAWVNGVPWNGVPERVPVLWNAELERHKIFGIGTQLERQPDFSRNDKKCDSVPFSYISEKSFDVKLSKT